ncbi:MAG: alpha/beta hydrolase [Pacificimonas sp.]
MSPKLTSADRLIEESYAISVDPERYDDMMQAWEAYLEDFVAGGDQDFDDSVIPQHFARALDILQRTSRLRAAERTPAQLADMTPGIGLVVGADGEVLATNAMAERLTGTVTGAALSASRLDGHAVRAILRWTNAVTRPPFLFVPCHLDDDALPQCLLATQIERAGSEAAPEYLLSAINLRIDGDTTTAFAEAFGLSAAEAEIAAALGQGLQTSEIVARRGVSIHTVRTQIRQITQKTETGGIPGLVKLVCGFAANYAYSDAARNVVAARVASIAARRMDALKLPGGRRLSWVEHGDPKGRPVLFFHNMLYGCLLTDPCAAMCRERGWRFIAPSRPGFGRTDPVPAEGGALLDAVARDARHLLDHLGIAHTKVIGHASGSMYAQAFAVANPARTDGLMFISHVPYWDESLLSKLPSRQRLVAQTTRKAPAALAFVVRAGAALINGGHHDRFIQALHKDIPADMAALKDKDAYAAIVDGLRHTVAQGGGGFIKDCPLILTDWSHMAAGLDMPIRVIHGADDRVATIAYIHGYRAAVPQIDVKMVEGAGQYLLYSHWPPVLDALEAMPVRR